MLYAKAEKFDMVFIYGECRQNKRAAARMYAERYHDCATPSRSTFANIIQTFEEPGNVDNKRKRLKLATGERHAVDILASVAHNPHVSSRQLERESVISQLSVLRILHTTCHFIRSSMAVTFDEGWNSRKGGYGKCKQMTCS